MIDLVGRSPATGFWVRVADQRAAEPVGGSNRGPFIRRLVRLADRAGFPTALALTVRQPRRRSAAPA